MKKLVLTLALCATLSAGAQVVNVSGIERVNLPEDVATQVAAISPAGDYLLLSTDTHQGLAKLDLATGERTVITNAPGAGYNVRISEDGNNIVYRQTSVNNKKLRQVAVQNYNVATHATEQVVKPTRDMKKVQASALKKASTAYATQNYELMVNVGGKARQLTPLGTGKRYIWVSLSPNGEKVLFFVSGDAAYVCNIDGSGLQKLGMIHAAKWLDDNIVVGMNDKDNGEVYTSSEIVAVNLQGQRQVLTSGDMIAMYPQCGGDKIAFTTDAGEVYMINLTK